MNSEMAFSYFSMKHLNPSPSDTACHVSLYNLEHIGYDMQTLMR